MQGRCITPRDVALIWDLMADNPAWNRTRLSRELCERWGWRNEKGRLKDMACRTLLLKLERLEEIRLPPPQQANPNIYRNRQISEVAHDSSPIESNLRALRPLSITPLAANDKDAHLFKYLLHQYHYLGHSNCVGENIKYMIRDCTGRPLACMLFGSAAWKARSRDSFIGWDKDARERNLFADEQYPVSDLAMGTGAASGQSPVGSGLPGPAGTLDGEVRTPDSLAGDLCGKRSIPWNMLPGCGLDTCRGHRRA